MKDKEIHKLAKQIAKEEMKFENASSSKEKAEIEQNIIKLCAKVKSFEDMMLIDELVQEILQNS
jgi:hypothetical protein